MVNGNWPIAATASTQIADPTELAQAGIPRIPARVPGNVELDLQRAGIIPDPFYADNIRRLRPFEFYEWWYTREFVLPTAQERPALAIDLCRAGHARHDLGQRRRGGQDAPTCWSSTASTSPPPCAPAPANQIAVRLGSAVNHARRFHYDAVSIGPEHRDEMLFVRKAAHMGGWDIMPRAISAGIWRSVWLESLPATDIEQIYYWTDDVDAEGATLGVRFQFRTDAPVLDGFTMRFHGVCGDHTFDYEWPPEFVSDQCPIRVPNARLWWPKGYGEPNCTR